VRITLKTPNPIIAEVFAEGMSDWAYPVSPKIVDRLKANPKDPYLTNHTDGAGPYVVVPSSIVPYNQCTYVPNKYYFDKSKQHWSKVVLKAITDPNAALAALRTGQVQVVERAAPSTVLAAKSAGFNVVYSPGYTYGLNFEDLGGTMTGPNSAPQLTHVKVRQALSYAVNRNNYLALWGPGAKTTSNPVPFGSGFPKKWANYYQYNPTKAKQLLAAAGYPNGFEFNASCSGSYYGPLESDHLCEAMAKDFAAIGVKMHVNVPANLNDDTATLGAYAVRGGGGGHLPTWIEYNFDMAPHAYAQPHGFHDPVTDRLFLKAERLPLKKGQAIYDQMVERWIQQAFFLIVADVPQYTFASKKIGGVAPATYNGGETPVNFFPK
jgi:peptide/nickel transport system substrate-binding protein